MERGRETSRRGEPEGRTAFRRTHNQANLSMSPSKRGRSTLLPRSSANTQALRRNQRNPQPYLPTVLFKSPTQGGGAKPKIHHRTSPCNVQQTSLSACQHQEPARGYAAQPNGKDSQAKMPHLGAAVLAPACLPPIPVGRQQRSNNPEIGGNFA